MTNASEKFLVEKLYLSLKEKLERVDEKYIFMFVIILLLSRYVLIPFLKAPVLIWDSIGHINIAKDLSLTDGFFSWDNKYWAGWVRGPFYPLLFHYILKVLSLFTDISIAYKMMLIIITLSTIVLIFKISATLIKDKTYRAIIIIITLAIYLMIRKMFLGGFLGNFLAGAAPAGLGTVFLLFVIQYILKNLKSSINIVHFITICSTLLSLLILTHLITTTVAALFIATIGIFSLINKDYNLIRKLVGTILLSICLCFFWILPFIALKKYQTSFGMAGLQDFFLLLAQIILLLLTIYKIDRVGIGSFFKDYKNVFLIFTFILGCLGIFELPTSLIVSTPHFFRYLFYYLIFYPISIYISIKETLVPIQLKSYYRKLAIILCIPLILIPYRGISEEFNYKIDLKENIPEISGRVLDLAQKDLFYLSMPRTAAELVSDKYNLAVFPGLLVESTENSLYTTYITNTLDPNNIAWGIPTEGLKGITDVKGLLRQLGINYLLTLNPKDKSFDNLDIKEKYEIGKVIQINNNNEIATLYLVKISDTKLIEPLTYFPKYIDEAEDNWNETYSYKDLWISSGFCGLYGGDAINTKKPNIEYREIDDENIKIDIKSETPTPVLVKYSNFPFWYAYDSEGNEIPLCTIFPNSMFLVAKGKINLKFVIHPYFKFINIFSFAFWLFILLYFATFLFVQRRKYLQKITTLIRTKRVSGNR